MKNENTKANIHDGHRVRLLNTICKAGLENISELQKIEYICTLIIPRVDVNPIAHALLDEFGSLANILDADYTFLAEVKGMTELSAKKLSLFKSISSEYRKSKLNGIALKDMKAVYQYVSALLTFNEHETLYLVALNMYEKVIAEQKFTSFSDLKVAVSFKEAARFVSKFNASKLFLCHNHPNGDCNPSKEDIEATEMIKDYCTALEIVFADHIIIGKDEIFSFQKNRTINHLDMNN